MSLRGSRDCKILGGKKIEKWEGGERVLTNEINSIRSGLDERRKGRMGVLL